MLPSKARPFLCMSLFILLFAGSCQNPMIEHFYQQIKEEVDASNQEEDDASNQIKIPEIKLYDGISSDASEITMDSQIHPFQEARSGIPNSSLIVIHNEGSQNLVITDPIVIARDDEDNSDDFSIAPIEYPLTILPGEREELEFTLNNPGNVNLSATVSIFSNDPDDSPYTFQLRYEPGPEITVFMIDSEVVELFDGEEIGALTDVPRDGVKELTFRIKNEGALPLSLGTPAIYGGATNIVLNHNVDTYELAPDDETEFTITFTAPTGPSEWSGSFSIDNNDTNENPFNQDFFWGAYTVGFATNSPSTIDNQIILKDHAIEAPVDPVKSGSTFVGWFTDLQFTDSWDMASDKITEDITLYAKWTTLPTYTVTYFPNANGAEDGSPPSVQTKIEGTDLTLTSGLGSLDLTGNTFSSWNTNPDGDGDTYAPGSIYTGDSDLSLYAQWEPITPPAAPTISSILASDGELAVSWDAVADADSYMVKYNTVNTLTGATEVNSTMDPIQTDTNVTIAGLTNGTYYYIWVSATNSDVTGSPSEPGRCIPLSPIGTNKNGVDWVISTNQTLSGTYYNVGTFRVDAGVTLSLTAFNGSNDETGNLTVYAENIEILGTINGNGTGYPGGSGGAAGQRGGNNSQPPTSGGTGGTGGAGLGSGGGSGGSGGGGGNAGQSWDGGYTPAIEGSPGSSGNSGSYSVAGNAADNELVGMGSGGGGSGGGGGGGGLAVNAAVFGGSGGTGGSGGKGGGVIRLYSFGTLTASGSLTVSGTSGSSGGAGTSWSGTDYYNHHGANGGAAGSIGGSGSGGGILVHGVSVDLAGGSLTSDGGNDGEIKLFYEVDYNDGTYSSGTTVYHNQFGN